MAEVDDAEQPDLHCFVETHLMGSYLNQAKRRLKKLGWRSFTTAAIPKTSKLYGYLGGDDGADPLVEDLKDPKFVEGGFNRSIKFASTR